MYLKPSEIRYSQSSIKAEFLNGSSLTTVFRQLVEGTKSVYEMGEIEVGMHDGNWVCFEGNRRLYLFKELERHELLTRITVRHITPNSYHLSRKYTTTNKGISVTVRGNPYISIQMAQIARAHKQGSDAQEEGSCVIQ